jgi:hypothetical protein
MDRILAIFPTALKVEAVLSEQSAASCRLGHRVMTFPQLVDALWAECADRRGLLSAVEQQVVLEEALAQSGHPVPPSPGLVAQLLGLTRQLKSTGAHPADLASALAESGPELSLLARVFTGYQQILERNNLADSYDREAAVLASLHACEDRNHRPRLLDGVKKLLVAEIYDFNLLQFMILAALIRIVGDAELTIQARPHPVDELRFGELTWNRFVEEESIADRVLPDFIERRQRPGRLGFVLEHLFAEQTPGTPAPGDDSLVIVEAADRYREVAQAARIIRRALDGEDGPPLAAERIAVMARELGPYADYLETLFPRYGIPLRLFHERPLIATAPARFVLSLFELAPEQYHIEGLGRLLRSPWVSVEASRYLEILEAVGYLDRAGGEPAELIRRRLERLAGQAHTDRQAVGAAGRAGFIERLLDAERVFRFLFEKLDVLATVGTVAEFAERLEGVLDALGFDAKTDLAADQWPGLAGSIRGVLAELRRGAALAGSTRVVEPARFAATLRQAFSQATLTPPGQRRQAVAALSVPEGRGLEFDMVVILGLDDGTFPSYHADEPLLPDRCKPGLGRRLAGAIRARLGVRAPRFIGRLLRTRHERNSEDWFLFFIALCAARRRAVLCRPETHGGLAPLARSPFINEVTALLAPSGEEAGAVVRLGANPTPAADDCFTATEILCLLASQGLLQGEAARRLVEPRLLASLCRRIETERLRSDYLALPTREARADDRPHPPKRARAGPHSGRVHADGRLQAALFGTAEAPRRWSATQLSALACCGYRFFARWLLGLPESRKYGYEDDPAALGTLVDEILRELFQSGIDWSDYDRAVGQALALLDRQQAECRQRAREASLFDLSFEQVRAMVLKVVAWEIKEIKREGRRQTRLGERFDVTLYNPEASATADALVLTGQFDRLDLFTGASGRIRKLRITDYKASHHASLYGPRADPGDEQFALADLQLPVYALGAFERFREMLDPDGQVEAGYFLLKGEDEPVHHQIPRRLLEGLVQTSPVSGQASQGTISTRLWQLVGRAARGEFDVDPLDCPEHCSYRRLCRFYKG